MSTPRYDPKSIEDIVFQHDHSEALIRKIVSGSLPFPMAGKNGILLYGQYGTGKTALARMLPDAIEKQKNGEISDYRFERIRVGNDGARIINSLQSQSELVPYGLDFHYFVLDEVDNLKGPAMSSLKSVMNMPGTIFVLTTNHIADIDKGVISRCHCVEFNAAPPEKWLPLIKRILDDHNVVRPSDETLILLIDECKGNARDIITIGFQLSLSLPKRLTA